jgi:Ca-activated chloride channel family protein
VIPDRDFVLLWTPRQEGERPALSVTLHREAQWTYFLALVAPPARHTTGSGVPREVILLIDHSGSMSGAKWEASDWAVNHFLSGLTEQDHFALGLFHSTTKWFARQPRKATAAELQGAARYLDENRDSGGTNLGVALEQALGLKRAGRDEQARHALIVTDAQVSDAGRILRLADQEAGRSQRRRISVLCIDAAPNAFLAHELAERGGGLARFLTSSPDEEDISTALEDVLADWAEPVLVGLRLEIDRGKGQASGREVLEDHPKTVIDLGDLPHGRAVWVAGRVPTEDAEDVRFRLTTRRDTVDTCQSSATGEQPALKALFGARRILGLEYLMHSGYQGDELKDQLRRLGYDPAEVQIDAGSAVYAENAREAARKALKDLLVRESLAYGLACAETAFVAVRTEAGQRVEGSVVVANALPAGWSDEFLLGAGAGLQMAMAAPLSAGKSLSLQAGEPRSSLQQTVQSIRRLGPRGRRRSAVSASYAIAPQELGTDRGHPTEAAAKTIFAGVPSFTNGQAVLWDGTLPKEATLSRVQVTLAEPVPDTLDRGLALWIYVEDLAMPRARIRLADLVRLGGQRPLNLRVQAGGSVRVVLVDPNGVWATEAPEMAVRIAR